MPNRCPNCGADNVGAAGTDFRAESPTCRICGRELGAPRRCRECFCASPPGCVGHGPRGRSVGRVFCELCPISPLVDKELAAQGRKPKRPHSSVRK